MIFGRVFERFPHLKVAFLEAGCGWVPYLIERIDPEDGLLDATWPRNRSRTIPSIPCGASGAARVLPPWPSRWSARTRFLYASDFRTSRTSEIMEVLEAFLAQEDVSPSAKQKILCENIEALYTLKAA